MEASIDMNNNTLNNVKDPEEVDQPTNKKYVDNQLDQSSSSIKPERRRMCRVC